MFIRAGLSDKKIPEFAVNSHEKHKGDKPGEKIDIILGVEKRANEGFSDFVKISVKHNQRQVLYREESIAEEWG